MPLELPNLDDRTFDDLVAEALQMIPAHAPEWTNHNPSDPGITLIEAFAELTEMLLYRLNRVTDANKLAFLNLLSGLNEDGSKKYTFPAQEFSEQPKPTSTQAITTAELNAELSQVIQQLRQSQRAITVEDFERLALQVAGVERVKCIPRRNLEISRTRVYPEYMSVVVVPISGVSAESVCRQVKEKLLAHRLLTTQIAVVPPTVVKIAVRVKLHLQPDAVESDVMLAAKKALQEWSNPKLERQSEIRGWPFGRSVYVAEIYQVLDGVEGVDYLERQRQEGQWLDEVQPIGVAKEERRVDEGQLSEIKLYPDDVITLGNEKLGNETIYLEFENYSGTGFRGGL
jgi:hypothetical protein